VDYLYRELSYGTLSRTLTLPEGLDTEQINAEYKDGLLESPLQSRPLHCRARWRSRACRRRRLPELPGAPGVWGGSDGNSSPFQHSCS
jgi:hypothetical protein